VTIPMLMAEGTCRALLTMIGLVTHWIRPQVIVYLLPNFKSTS
jgi:hypothetical protein